MTFVIQPYYRLSRGKGFRKVALYRTNESPDSETCKTTYLIT